MTYLVGQNFPGSGRSVDPVECETLHDAAHSLVEILLLDDDEVFGDEPTDDMSEWELAAECVLSALADRDIDRSIKRCGEWSVYAEGMAYWIAKATD